MDEMNRKEFLKTLAAGVSNFALLKTSLAGSKAVQRPLGNTGIKVSPLALGASRVKDPGLIRAALAKGINFLDTGRQYSNGQNEVMIGQALEGIRDRVIIQSKLSLHEMERGDRLNAKDADKRIKSLMTRSIDKSLQALRTDWIDVMLIHYIKDPVLMNHEAVLETFTKAKEQGKIRAFGFSTHSDQIEVLEAFSEQPKHQVIMLPFNHKGSYVHSLHGRYSEWNQPLVEEYLVDLHAKGIGINAMKTCSAGELSLSNSDPSFLNAIHWVIQKPFITSAAVAMVNYDELEHNTRVLDRL